MGAEESVFMDSDLVIRPSVNDVGSAAFDQFDETERLGYEEAVKRIREWVSELSPESPVYRALFAVPKVELWIVCLSTEGEGGMETAGNNSFCELGNTIDSKLWGNL